MLKRLVLGIGLMVASLAVATPAQAAAVIDFGTGVAGVGGTITVFGDGSVRGVAVPIGTLNVTGAPVGNGGHAVSGTAFGSGVAPFTPAGPFYGSLDFATGGLAGLNSISITGCVLDLGVCGAGGAPITLLSGTISGFDSSKLDQGLVSAFGPDAKSPVLLTALGLPLDTPFAFFGFSLYSDVVTRDGIRTGTAISTDIKNTAVPEPGSMVLLGTGLLGLARAARRRKGAAQA